MAGCLLSKILPNNSQTETGAASLDDQCSRASLVTDYLLLSGCTDITVERMRAQRVSCVINVARGMKCEVTEVESIEYIEIPLEDEIQQDISEHFERVLDAIDRHRHAGGRTLVFCGMGISRSASFVLAYMMKVEGMTLREAYHFVQSRRKAICPNVGFFEQLIALEREIFGGKQTVNIINPAGNLQCADVVWEEVYNDAICQVSGRRRSSAKGVKK